MKLAVFCEIFCFFEKARKGHFFSAFKLLVFFFSQTQIFYNQFISTGIEARLLDDSQFSIVENFKSLCGHSIKKRIHLKN